jgi:hypothetical protein
MCDCGVCPSPWDAWPLRARVAGSGAAPQHAIALLRRAASCSFTAYLITLSPEIEETILRQAAKHRRPHVSGRGMLRSTLHRSSGPDLQPRAPREAAIAAPKAHLNAHVVSLEVPHVVPVRREVLAHVVRHG